MRSKPIHEVHGQRTFVVVPGIGDEVRDRLGRSAGRERLFAAQISVIGASERAVFRFFDPEAQEHRPLPVEVASLNGDTALGRPASGSSTCTLCSGAATERRWAASSRKGTCAEPWRWS